MTTEQQKASEDTRMQSEADEQESAHDNVRVEEQQRFLRGIAAVCDAKWATITELWHRLCVNGPYESLVASIVDIGTSNTFKTPSEFLHYYCFYGGSEQAGMAGLRELHNAIKRDPFDSRIFEECLDRAYIYYLQSRGPRVLNDEECALVDAFITKAELSTEEKLVFEVFHGLKNWRRPIIDNDFMAIYRDALSNTAKIFQLSNERVREIEQEAGAKVRRAAGGYASPLRDLRGWRYHVLGLVRRIQQLDVVLCEFKKYCADRLGTSSEVLLEEFAMAGEEKPLESSEVANQNLGKSKPLTEALDSTQPDPHPEN